ncbi:methyltransferase domain-containing protein [Cyanobium gracile UHCC 0139]|uniref:Methyltransferase domain-containing protein n=1 Tax=Cyanobium gracile UHCC 0139 TaxID=3110308 RepID=A0ABU5RRP5_9CYAN|nr:methyltransferase domain-containing protein [Cyanobium gracile]MEA5390452.1 methyltransferase domain-containing protein [Cyanobium gracile UHCC 0139]
MHRSSFDKMQAFREGYLDGHRHLPLVVLDVGSAAVAGEAASYRSLFQTPGWTYLGLDREAAPNVDIVPEDPYHWSALADGSVDVVVSGQALEHIDQPWRTMGEIARVLRFGGLAMVIAPSAGPVHRFPLDCWRFYPDGMAALARQAGLDVIETHWDTSYAYPENAFWGEACAILQKPCPQGERGVIGTLSDRQVIQARVLQQLRALHPWTVRRRLLGETLLRARIILRCPLERLNRLELP